MLYIHIVYNIVKLSTLLNINDSIYIILAGYKHYIYTIINTIVILLLYIM